MKHPEASSIMHPETAEQIKQPKEVGPNKGTEEADSNLPVKTGEDKPKGAASTIPGEADATVPPVEAPSNSLPGAQRATVNVTKTAVVREASPNPPATPPTEEVESQELIPVNEHTEELDLNHGRIGKIENLENLKNLQRYEMNYNFVVDLGEEPEIN